MTAEPEIDTTVEPDWDAPISIALTPAAIIHAVFPTADSVHTGWDSCIDQSLVVAETNAVDDVSGNHCRLIRQEYMEDHAPEVTWQDWTVELKLSNTYISGHWRVEQTVAPSEWEWCRSEAESAFTSACTYIGKRVRRGLLIEEPPSSMPTASRTHH